MSNLKVKISVFIVLLLSMLSYVIWVFYISEPKYIDSCYKMPEKYDYVSLPEYRYLSDTKTEVNNGIVMQVDKTTALKKLKKYNSDHFYELNLKEKNYRIIGKGTIYHKINDYVGFNIMQISQLFISIFMVLIIFILFSILFKILND